MFAPSLVRAALHITLLWAVAGQVAAGLGAALPYGGEVAFVSDRDGDEDIYLLDVERGALHNLTRADGSDRQPLWSPDGARLAFLSDRDGYWNVFVMSATGGERRRITDNRRSYRNVTWSPDGRRLAFSSLYLESGQIVRSNIHIADVDMRQSYALPTPRGRMVYAPIWSADGQRIQFNTQLSDSLGIYHMRVDGSDLRAFAADDTIEWAQSKPRVGPDDMTFVIYFTGGYTDVCVVNEAKRFRRCLTGGIGHNIEPVWRP